MESRITTKEVLEKTFSKKFNGYDPVEVDEFLDRILKTMEELEQGIAPSVAASVRGNESAPTGGNKAAAKLIEQAEKRAQEIMNATNENAVMIVGSAQARAQELSAEAKKMEHQIQELKKALHGFMDDQMKLFDEKIDGAYRAAVKDEVNKAVPIIKEVPLTEYDKAMSRSDEFLRSLREEGSVPHLSTILGEDDGNR